MSFRKIVSICFLIILICLGKVKAQTEGDPAIEQIIESVAENTGEDFDYTELIERLNTYLKSPLNINKSSKEDLMGLMFLSPLQINSLLNYRILNGPFIDSLELQSVDDLDVAIIKKLLPFVKLTNNSLSTIDANKLLVTGKSDVMFRYGRIIEGQQGFLISDTSGKSRYLGTPERFFVRYRYTYNQHLAVSINLEKDAGEKINNGFDFYSGNLFFKNLGKITKLAVGDYSLQFGEGLTMWSGLSFGKGAAISTVPKQDFGLKSYSSVNEVLFFRGLAATIDFKNIKVTPFLSYRKLDAGMNDNDQQEITSLAQTGYHRTATESSNRNSLSQRIYGANIQYNKGNLSIGSTTYHTKFNHSFEPGNFEYNKFEFTGNNLTNTGLYYNYNWRNIYFFGEASHSLNSGSAFLNGAIASLSPQISLILLYRNYQKNYHSFYNQAISEASTAVNEKGFYSGLVIKPSSKFELVTYADLFQYPWLKFGVDAPSKGFEIFSQLNYSPSKKLRILLRYKYKNKQENDDIDNTSNFLQNVVKQNYRLELSYKINKDIQVRNRVEIVQYKKESFSQERGYLVLQDILYNPLTSRFSGNIRFSIFDTKGFDTRLYAYENDILYSYSVPAFQNSGTRFYLNGRYTLKRGVDLWLNIRLQAIQT